jgi:iron complex outermembrane receptor protein
MIRTQMKLLFAVLLLVTTGAFAQQPDTLTHASTAADASGPLPLVTETVTVTAPGEVRTEQTVSEQTIKEMAPGTSPIRAIAQMPSVNFTSADPYGAYEWAVRISMRGFNQNQLGFTLDEIPLGDMSYGNWNGLHISRAIMDENIGRIVLSQGTGALETASNSNLGGTVQFYSADPADKRSFTAEQSFGSFNAYRTVGRFESGLLGGHTKFYFTGVSQLTDKWKGHGDIGQNYWQLNGKVVHYFGSKGVLTAFFDYGNRHETDYQDLSKVYVKKLGYNFDNYGNWGQSTQAAYAAGETYALSAAKYGASNASCNMPLTGTGYSFPGAVATLDPTAGEDPCDAAYYAGAGLRKDILSGATYRAQLTSKLTWKTTAYGHGNDGIGLWFAPMAEYGSTLYNEVLAVTGSPIAMRSSEYGIKRGGFLSSLKYETSRNKLEGGAWYEKEDFTLARRFYPTTAGAPGQSLDSFPKHALLTQWAYDFGTYLYQIHLQDQFKVTNDLTVSAGFKTAETTTNGKLAIPASTSAAAASYAQGQLTSGKPFLPQFGANYKLNKESEIYGDAAYNVRAYVAGGNGFGPAPWGVTQTAFDATKNTIKPETSWTEEVGYRYTSGKVKAEASYFHVDFSNRLLALQQGPGIAGNASVLVNVSGVTTNGLDAAVTVPVGYGFTLYNGLTWNRSTYDDNVNTYSGTTEVTLPYKGKIAVDTPEFMWKTQLGYHNKGFFSTLDADYMSTRYYSYDNTGSVDGRFLSNFGAGYNRGELGPLQDLKLQLSIYNLFGERYYSSIGTNGFVGSDTTGTADTLQVGSPRAFGGSLSVRF